MESKNLSGHQKPSLAKDKRKPSVQTDNLKIRNKLITKGGTMTRVQKTKITKINNCVSFIVGFIAFMAMASEVEDLRYWYIPFIAGAVLLVVIYVNRKVNNYIEQN